MMRLSLALLLVGASGLSAQFGRYATPVPVAIHNVPYDGRFTFARLSFETGPGGYYYRGMPAWAHGYSGAERNLMQILNSLSTTAPRLDASVVYNVDDPALFDYPVAYMAEADFWTLTDKEAAGLRDYLLKGGFLIFDDFRDPYRFGGTGWDGFVANMRRVLPDAQIVDQIGRAHV